MLKKSLQERNLNDCTTGPSRAVPIDLLSR